MSKKINNILLIDDNEDDNFFHRIILKEMNVAENIHIVESGIEALDYLSKCNAAPDLIFLDINMPKMNGWEFLEEYAKLNVLQKAQVVIIMLTTSLNPSDQERALTIPAINSFETKPLNEKIINRVITHYFSGSESE